MRVAAIGFQAVLLVVASRAVAQHGGGPIGPAAVAPAEARQHDFLVGQWDLTVKVPATSLATRIHGMPKLVGTWKAWRAFDGYGIQDELRITDASGNPMNLTHSLRYYDRTARQWTITALDAYRGKVVTSTATWADGAMSQEAKGVDQEGKAFLSRARFTDITPSSFTFRQDRSYDEGKSWKEGTLVIEAKRVAATAPR
ncbi:MAG TPA: hypothetical protein VF862_07870 [Gemmatimonadales bacterium]